MPAFATWRKQSQLPKTPEKAGSGHCADSVPPCMGSPGLSRLQACAKGFGKSISTLGLRRGGRVQSAIIILRPAEIREQTTYVAYIRASWRVGYYLYERARPKGERVYWNVGRLILQLQESFGIQTPLRVFRAGSPDLHKFEGIRDCDKAQGAFFYKDAFLPDNKAHSIVPAEHQSSVAGAPDAVDSKPEAGEEPRED